ncbi:MAG: TRAP transporter permease [Syntrophomonadaceae bacterium]|jgi:TRAP transporter 4TM/12TM fusion protein
MGNLLQSAGQVIEDCGLKGTKGKIVAVLAIITSTFFLYTACFGSLPALIQRSILLILVMPLVYLLYPTKKEGGVFRVLDVLMVIVGPIPFIYMANIQDSLMMRGGIPNTMDVIMGVAAILIVVEATRRKIGWALPIIATVFLIYAFFGPYMPGAFQHRGLDLEMIIASVFLGEEGIFGTPVAVTANFIMLFILFGAFLQAAGAGEFFIDIANALFGWMRGGPAKAATVGSGLMGMLNGSAVANVVTTGTFTIPLMKKTGYKPEVAGAVEAVASTGGQIMPPIMGAAAFIMAEFLQIPYIEVVYAAAIPALLYYVALFFMVDLEAVKAGLKGMKKADLPDWKKVLKEGWVFMLPIFTLIYFLGIVMYSPQKSAFYTIIVLFIVAAFRASTRMGFYKTVKALIQGAIGGLEVAVVCACAGIVIGILMRTGLGLSLTGILVEISQGILPLLMVLAMIVSIIMGMGLPTSACYIIVAVLIAPAMVQMGVEPIAAHLFAFYFAILSAITPPVALAAYAGAGVANADPMKTGVAAFKLGLAGFIVPFMFVYGPTLLMIGSPGEIILSLITAILGVYALAICIVGVQFTKVPALFRLMALASALCLIKPGLLTDIIGIGLLAVVSLANYWRNRRKTVLQPAPNQSEEAVS